MNWLKKTFSDEKGMPSANRQVGFIAVFAAIVFAAFYYPENIVFGFLGLAGGIFTGTQVVKFSRNKRRRDDFEETEFKETGEYEKEF